MSLRDDIETMARGWRWGRKRLVPGSVEVERTGGRGFPTSLVRGPVASGVRDAIQGLVLAPLLQFEINRRVHGLESLESVEPPVVFVANHSSHLDAPVLLTSLPRSWRRRCVVGAASDYFFDVAWRSFATALVFNAFPIERKGRLRGTKLAGSLLDDGWSLIFFPEGTRSSDGWMGDFRPGAALVALMKGVPVVPVALSGTYAAMPRGKSWPVPGRPAVSVRFGRALRASDGEGARDFNDRIRHEVALLLSEERTTWWDALRRDTDGALDDGPDPGAAHWRRVWEATRPPASPPGAWPGR
jgi:1-acyl-sn-glycerol-3-phosphate acyltransferase